ncbi:hypothetical protein MMC10_003766 [Thelotrema lepadinum]|nr:hypothetical protein [Thelotrema lepadinum]
MGQQGDTVWGVVSISTSGDRIPLLSPEYSAITSLGASQMYSAGEVFRNRYIAPSNISGNYTIAGISRDQIDNSQTFVYTRDTIFIDQSAQAFMAGLYPPLANATFTDVLTGQGQTLIGNNTVTWPDNGVQYPIISSFSDRDYNDIYLEGMANCPQLELSLEEYESSPSFQSVVSSTNNFYESLSSNFAGAIPEGNDLESWNLSYSHAYEIWDYLNFQYLHDSSSSLTADTLAQARYLADSYAWSLYGNYSGDIRTMGGQTLIAFVLDMFANNVYTLGAEYKISNLFVSFEPMVSLFSILGLDDLSDTFRGLPNLASSVAFELYTNNTVSIPNPVPSNWYPNQDDLFIRFLFRNGTTTTTDLSAGGLNVYPIFGNNQDHESMPFQQWASAVENVMMLDVGNWCIDCQATSVFCAAATNGTIGLSPVSTDSFSSHQVSPVIAGVIGALVALAVAGILFLIAMLVFGVRFRRIRPKRKSELGGFKGTEKLASDPDLPSRNPITAKNGAVIGASVVPEAEGATGHRRVESWELKEGRGAAGGNVGRPSYENDAEGRMKAVEAIESV